MRVRTAAGIARTMACSGSATTTTRNLPRAARAVLHTGVARIWHTDDHINATPGGYTEKYTPGAGAGNAPTTNREGIMAIALVIIAIVAVIAVWLITINNGIVMANNRCDNAWQTIDAQLQRRNDLIPNLVETVKGYAGHERETLEAVTSARAAVAGASTPEDKMAASNELSGALSRLMVSVEAYPELKANTNFQQLQTDLTDTENKISYARMSYNDCVLAYNNAIQTFPGSLIAGGRTPRTGFEADESARTAPKVQF